MYNLQSLTLKLCKAKLRPLPFQKELQLQVKIEDQLRDDQGKCKRQFSQSFLKKKLFY